ncbi:MAG: class I adenylate-forming enzyme family protein [Deltaproteobacteria bacterium]|nr:class I adenylate-forming enzyme family protein [Deltaproteobacteria bacterium]
MSGLKYQTIFQAFSAIAEKYPQKVAVYFLGSSYSYRDILNLSEKFASGLYEMGMRKGDRILMYLPNSVQFIVSWLGIQRLGAVPVPISPIYTAFDLKYMANDTGAKIVICSDRNYGYVKQALPETQLEHVIFTGLIELLPWWKKAFDFFADKAPKGKVEKGSLVSSMKDVIKRGANPAPKPDICDRDIAQIMYTGGTTKHPKGVPMSHGLFLISSEEQLDVRNPLFPKHEDVILAGSPLFHIAGQTCSLATIVVGGGTMIVFPKVNLDAFFDAIQKLKAKSLVGVPAFYRMILEHDRVDQYDLSSLIYCFSAADVLPHDVARRWTDKFHLPVYQGYGATETCGGVIMCPTDRESPQMSMGLRVPSKQIRITEQEGLDKVPLGDPGELLVHSELMVSAYLNKPEETETSFVTIDGKLWYRTGDIVRQDENGFVYFVDRTVDAIKHKGYRVSASEVEAVLQEHPAVIESCVVGIPDKKVGERIKAFVVLKKDVKGVAGYELTKFCRDRLPAYKIPQYIEFRDMLPKSKVGKLLRKEIRSEERKRLET